MVGVLVIGAFSPYTIGNKSIDVVYASEIDSVQLEKMIKSVKSVISIPKELSVFESNYWVEENDNKKLGYFSFEWRDKEFKNYISITTDEKGNIISYCRNNYEEKQTGLGDISKEQAKKAADSFIKQLTANKYPNIKLIDSNTVGSEFNFTYCDEKNGISAEFSNLRISVNKFNNEIMSYYAKDLIENSNVNYIELKSDIKIEKAREIFKKELGTELEYFSNFDWSKNKLSIFPAYSIVKSDEYVDANTGKVVKKHIDNRYLAREAGSNGVLADKNKSTSLTPEEQKVVDNIKGLITQDEAVSIIYDKVEGIDSSMKVNHASLYEEYINDGTYIWNIYFEGANASIDAKTKEIMNFYVYENNTKENQVKMTRENAQKVSEDFIKSNSPTKFNSLKLQEDMTSANDLKNTNNSFLYSRVVNGIVVNENNIYVEVNNKGKIQSYNCEWFNTVEFPVLNNIITNEKAFDIIEKESGFKITYIKIDENTAVPAYGFVERPFYLVDAYNGNLIGYNGKPYVKENEPMYDDISGKWYESYVNKLLENGYYLDGDKFNGNIAISQENFFRYLYSPMQGSYDSEELYEMLINEQIIEKDEINKAGMVTRQQAAKFVIRFLNYDMAGRHNEIYKNLFKDNVSKEYLGYATLAKGFGIMQGDAKGRFNGNKSITNAEAAVVIYNTLQLR